MDAAAQNGDLEVVKWLHENRDEGCTGDALCFASKVRSRSANVFCLGRETAAVAGEILCVPISFFCLFFAPRGYSWRTAVVLIVLLIVLIVWLTAGYPIEVSFCPMIGQRYSTLIPS